MEIITYKYSRSQTWFVIVLLSGLLVFSLFGLVASSGIGLWQPLAAFALFLAGMLAYVCYKFFLPLLRGETILGLDKDKLHYAVKNSTVYWKDVESIDYIVGTRSGGWSIRFAMKDGSPVKRISTLYIAGDDQTIYDTIAEYFEKYK